MSYDLRLICFAVIDPCCRLQRVSCLLSKNYVPFAFQGLPIPSTPIYILLMRTVITSLILLSRTYALYICYSVDMLLAS